MGRLLKKKDPGKKKTLRGDNVSDETGAANGANVAVTPRPTPLVKKIVPPVKTKTGIHEPNIIEKSIQFLREVKIELKKVTWPGRKQTIGSTLVVLVLWMVISLFLGMVDFGLSSLMRFVLP